MKQFYLSLALAAVSISASAQFANTSSRATGTSTNGDYNTLYLVESPSQLRVDVKDADNLSFNSIGFGYAHGFSLSQQQPLFLEVGARLQYSQGSDEEKDEYGKYETVYKWISAAVPVRLLYSYSLSDQVALQPFVGLQLRYNIMAMLSEKVEKYHTSGLGYYYRSYDLFEEQEVGHNDLGKRTQIGWQVGLNIRYSDHYFIGASYGQDFSEIAEDIKVGAWNFTVGYVF